MSRTRLLVDASEATGRHALDAAVVNGHTAGHWPLGTSALPARAHPASTRQLGAGARIVSHAFSMGDWEPDTIDRFEDERGNTRTLYLWRHDGTTS